MNRTTTAVLVALACATAAPAHADIRDYKNDAIAVARVGADVTFATANRVRRSIAFGTHVGTYTGMAISPLANFATGVTFGMALYTFDIPSILDIQKLLQSQVEHLVKEEVRRIVAEGRVPDVEAIARKAWADLKEDIIGQVRPRTLEKPKYGLILEGIVQFQPYNAMGARLSATYGVGPISLGLGGSFLRGEMNTTAFVGPEISLRLTPTGVYRTPVFDLYLRADLGFDEGDRPYVITVGGRALLDLI